MSVATADRVTLVALDGTPVRTLAADPQWVLEDRAGSTNRITVTVPLAAAADVTSDCELIFRGRRFKVTGVDRIRSTRDVEIIADEAQVELADNLVPSFKLDEALLTAALTRALTGSQWTSAGVADNSGTYYADLKDRKSSELLTFLVNQSGLVARYDSVARTVALVQPVVAPADRVITYGVGASDIQRTEEAPTATVIIPTGANGLTVANVNSGSEQVEDYSWYTELGVPLATARRRFRRVYYWADERYTVAQNLLADARRLLAQMSRPQVGYTLTSALAADTLRVGDRVWVVDEPLGVRIGARVSRVQLSSGHARDEVELEHLPDSLGASVTDQVTGDSNISNESVMFQAISETAVTLLSSPAPVLRMSINVFADTAFKVGAVVRVQSTTAGLLTGYFLLNGNRVGPEIMQTAAAGWVTIGLPFLLTQIQANAAVNLDLYLATTGAATVPLGAAEMYVETRGAYGGITNERPDRSVTDEIEDWLHTLVAPADAVTITFPPMINITPTEHLDDWFTLPAPEENAIAGVNPIITVSGTTVTFTNALPTAVYTLVFNGVQSATITTDAAGYWSGDVTTIIVLDPARTYRVFVEETLQYFSVTTP